MRDLVKLNLVWSYKRLEGPRNYMYLKFLTLCYLYFISRTYKVKNEVKKEYKIVIIYH